MNSRALRWLNPYPTCCCTSSSAPNIANRGSIPTSSKNSSNTWQPLAKLWRAPFHAIGGADDHIHIACSPSRTATVSQLVQELKQDSSKWIKTKGRPLADFSWQNGYGAFSIGQSQLDDLRGYIANQREHHHRVTYQDEYRRICEKYGVPIDERFAWD